MAATTDSKLLARFASKIVVDDLSGCWQWIGVRDDPSGFGRFWLGGHMAQAHRVAWEIHGGALPEGRGVRRTCRVSFWGNPERRTLAERPYLRHRRLLPSASPYTTPNC